MARNWTVAVYLAGGENVSREMIPALHDMRDAALTNRSALRVMAQFEPDRKAPRLFAFDDALRSHFSAPGTPRGRASTPMGLANYECGVESQAKSRRPSSLRLLRDFVATARRAAGSSRLMLVISGHANGAVGEFLGHRKNGEPLYLGDVASALRPKRPAANKIDIVGLDCCNMSMVEVGFELAPWARYLVASEGYILNHGWPYRAILDAVVDLEPEEAGIEIVRQYVSSYSDYAMLDVPSHCAVTDLEKIHSLADPMRRLGRLLTAQIEDPDVWRPVVLAHWEAQSYKDEEYVDLADFCDRLRTHIDDPQVQEACADVIEVVGRVVTASCFSGSSFQFSTGLSIYFPWSNDAVKARGKARGGASELEGYRELAFSQETLWGDFLDAYLLATRRAPRAEPAPASLSSAEVPDPAITPGAPPLRAVPPVRSSARREPSRDRIRSPAPFNDKEVTVAIKRLPPWNSKGGQTASPVKNHPRAQEGDESSLPVRRLPPWNSKGSLERPSRLKNHPQKREG